MPEASRIRPAAVVCGIAALVLVAQALVGRPVAGPAGLVALMVPPVALLGAVGPARGPWPERLLAAVALVVALLVLAGIVAALSPRGISASAVAQLELLLLTLAIGAWLWRRPGRSTRGANPNLGSAPEPAGDNRTSRDGWRDTLRALRAAPVTVALVLAGLVLGIGGLAVATKAALAQDVGTFVQFWTTPAVTGQPTQVGVRNDTTGILQCRVVVTRPGEPALGFQVDALEPGQSWSGELAPADPNETARWQLGLTCDGALQSLQRVLLIDPPGIPPALASPST